MNYVFRLTRGQDLRKEIQNFVNTHNHKAAIIKCAVGCLYEANIRLANAENSLYKKEPFEIVSLIGTISVNECHMHISLADKNGIVIGGHLNEGCLVDSTSEICIEELDNYVFAREFDKSTGYKELVIKEK